MILMKQSNSFLDCLNHHHQLKTYKLNFWNEGKSHTYNDHKIYDE